MRALQLVEHGRIAVVDTDVPEIGPGEVLIEVAGAGLCHSDIHVRHSPASMMPPPMTLGHETAGRVAALGDGVDAFAVGDAVLVFLVWSCGTCRACVQGRENSCERGTGRQGLPLCPGLAAHGGMAEYMKVDARFVEPLGDLDPVTAGPLADAGLTTYHAIDGARNRLGPGTTAVVLGIGGLGHTAVQILAATTATRIIAVDSAEEKLELATALGADHVFASDASCVGRILELTDGIGVDAVFDCVGVQATVDIATQIIGRDGALRVLGLGGGTFAWTGFALPWGADVRTSYAGTRADQRAVIDLARRGLVTIESETIPLEDAVAAFDALEAGKIKGRAILVPDHS
ncbi:NAD(P)-dependent alcohol dehydrogenase [Prescottella equi]|uniref:NAD(P)-dependent alcohol dehydrogenase n=1 Tax=Rhodococcus hoagii TaxID=43767 RepID=UPI000A0FF189|nr:NAD(P)-dependent alcohol dehydrogenase [Prescottella equi]MBM4589140.1 alcohol dehydrogenase catalytic domain-containing protein [Prescottella equi]MBU4614342.1 NAD(P)-dependent alcohol dehydrogenase [Rhodococcus sp. GG48]NKS36082.1 alcohol dehydrogenase catalytic domain-containing protein [Prescottella equi]ORL10085.1 dehydrogenase [Prescottella equi]